MPCHPKPALIAASFSGSIDPSPLELSQMIALYPSFRNRTASGWSGRTTSKKKAERNNLLVLPMEVLSQDGRQRPPMYTPATIRVFAPGKESLGSRLLELLSRYPSKAEASANPRTSIPVDWASALIFSNKGIFPIPKLEVYHFVWFVVAAFGFLVRLGELWEI